MRQKGDEMKKLIQLTMYILIMLLGLVMFGENQFIFPDSITLNDYDPSLSLSTTRKHNTITRRYSNLDNSKWIHLTTNVMSNEYNLEYQVNEHCFHFRCDFNFLYNDNTSSGQLIIHSVKVANIDEEPDLRGDLVICLKAIFNRTPLEIQYKTQNMVTPIVLQNE